MTFCPFCGVRQDIDLRQIHFRDLGTDASLACPSCSTALSVIEFETNPILRIERCNACHDMFFNPGELEAILDAQTHPLVWLDLAQITQIGEDYGFHHEVVYRKCPMCPDRMNHVNFGRHSGVILDRCGVHGVWVDGGELRRLTEWWRAGGKLIFQQNEADKTRQLYQKSNPLKNAHVPGTVESPEKSADWTWASGTDLLDAGDLLVAAAEIVVSFVTD